MKYYIFTVAMSGIKQQFAADSQTDLINKFASGFDTSNANFVTFDDSNELIKYLDETGSYDDDKKMIIDHESGKFKINDYSFAAYFDESRDKTMVMSFDGASAQQTAEYNYWLDQFSLDLKSIEIINTESLARQKCYDLYGDHSDHNQAISQLGL